MIDSYCNQSITLKTPSSMNKYTEPTYSTSTIQCRFEYNRKIIRNREGKEVVSEAAIYTESEIKPDDLITYGGVDWIVIHIANQEDLDGSIKFYEARLGR